MFSKKLSFGLILVVALGLAVSTYLVRTNHNKDKSRGNNKASASQSTKTLGSTDEWQAGTSDNITFGSGEIEINAKASTQIDFASIVAADHSKASASRSTENAWKGCDGSPPGVPSTMWNILYDPFVTPDPTHWWKVDLGSAQQMNRLTNNALYTSATDGTMCFQYSLDDGTYTTIQCKTNDTAEVPDWSLDHTFDPPVFARYIKITFTTGNYHASTCPGCAYYLRAIELWSYKPGSATHTTAATQIDGGDNFWQWQTFTPTETVPDNSTLTYKFRSSADSTTWTEWSASQTIASQEAKDISSLVTSRSGDTKYKYLQVQATLVSTNGVATPTIDNYSIGYHINRPPDKPTGLTAVIGD